MFLSQIDEVSRGDSWQLTDSEQVMWQTLIKACLTEEEDIEEEDRLNDG